MKRYLQGLLASFLLVGVAQADSYCEYQFDATNFSGQVSTFLTRASTTGASICLNGNSASAFDVGSNIVQLADGVILRGIGANRPILQGNGSAIALLITRSATNNNNGTRGIIVENLTVKSTALRTGTGMNLGPNAYAAGSVQSQNIRIRNVAFENWNVAVRGVYVDGAIVEQASFVSTNYPLYLVPNSSIQSGIKNVTLVDSSVGGHDIGIYVGMCTHCVFTANRFTNAKDTNYHPALRIENGRSVTFSQNILEDACYGEECILLYATVNTFSDPQQIYISNNLFRWTSVTALDMLVYISSGSTSYKWRKVHILNNATTNFLDNLYSVNGNNVIGNESVKVIFNSGGNDDFDVNTTNISTSTSVAGQGFATISGND